MQDQGGSQFPAGAAGPPLASELATATPISVQLPLAAAGSSEGNGFDPINVVERSESGCASPAGNRWPRQETMALLKIRSDMDRVFQEATLKAPLWEHVSRKLAEEGYQRSAKKCKEKFENVFKYYKRTKEARAGKSYRFFSQLEALRPSSSSSSAAAAAAPAQLPPIVTSSSAAAAAMVNTGASSSGAAAALLSVSTVPVPAPTAGEDPNSADTSSFSGTESEGGGGRKRKREAGADEESGKMMAFFEGLIQQVMDQQEAMLERFLEVIERREQNRMIREEAWRRQEKTRLSREHELAAQERAAAASRDDAIISFLQKLTGQKIPINPPPVLPQQPPPPESTAEETPITAPPPQVHEPDPAPILGSSSTGAAATDHDRPLISSSRWPKSEVHALIQLRSGMESKYQESNPKGPLWEEISAGMRRLGYNRSAKRCKEKWENINKYFKKVKESNKSRPEDAKTCPYFHQLDALYRTKLLIGGGGGGSSPGAAAQNVSTDDDHLAMIISSTSKQQDDTLSFFEQGSGSKPEDIVKKMKKMMMMMLMGQQAIVEPESFQFRIVQHMMPRSVLIIYIVEELDRTTSRLWSGRDLFLS